MENGGAVCGAWRVNIGRRTTCVFMAESDGANTVMDCSRFDDANWLELSARRHKAYGLMAMQLVYFAKVRETIGVANEAIAPVDTICSIADMIDWLSQKSPEYAAAFADRSKLRFALDQVMATANTPIAHAKELAIFPPVTGG